MSLNYVTLTLDLNDGQGNAITTGLVAFEPSAQLTGSPGLGTQAAIRVDLSDVPRPRTVKLLATDNGAVAPSGWGWSVAFSGVPGEPDSFDFFLPYTSGASQNLSAQAPTSSVTTMQAYMPLPSGTATASQVPVASGSGEASAWTTLTAASVGADASGAAATAQSNAESFATSAVATETSRAETAEALALPLAGGTMSGVLNMGNHGIVSVGSVAASGITGAGNASRYVGATTSGAPASGTFNKGDFIIDQTGSLYICTTAGSPGTWAPVGAARTVSGQLLCAPSVYAPGSQTIKGVSSTTMAAIFSTSINTGSFTAPPSGDVVVEASFMSGSGSGTFAAFGLAAHATVTPIIGNENVFNFWTSDVIPVALRFYVTGLTPGSSYNFDLLAAASTGAVNIYANAQTSTTPTLSSAAVGGPCMMTVRAV